ncbi:CRISPR-associated helicase Cas3' [Paenibacillus sp. M1]|uniref:CRISPR-associated helicase Cas3 n=1 Tax=Paenibacillus haidiansis TaxID=1574488 RepID=A0ABU7VR99_9BACL
MSGTSSINQWLTDEAENILLAHLTEKESERPNETLEEHSNLVMEYAETLLLEGGVESAIERGLNKLSIAGKPLGSPAQDQILIYFRKAIYLHDLGKLNPAFQRIKMKNSAIGNKGAGLSDSSHSLLSAVLYLHIFLSELRQLEQKPLFFSDDKRHNKRIFIFLRHVLYVFAYVISRHHTYLGAMDSLVGDQLTAFEQVLRQQVTAIREKPEILDFYRNKHDFLDEYSLFEYILSGNGMRINEMHSPSYPFFIVVKLLYSTLIASDFRATYHYMEQTPQAMNYFGERLPLQPVLDAYRGGNIYKAIQKYKVNRESMPLGSINRLRSELFLETERRLLKRPGESIYYLEGPTGSGKTNMSINLALQLLNRDKSLNKLIYAFPFNSLIEQTRQTLEGYFNKDGLEGYKVEVINSITPMISPQEQMAQKNLENGDYESGEPEKNFKSILLQRQLLQYPVTLTSHVNLFNYFFGTGREVNLAFAHLCNSVIVLDEIQSYRNKLWKEIIHFLRSFAELMNIKFIIMSATLPQLDLLLKYEPGEKEVETYSLVLNRNTYFNNPLFRDRVNLHFDWLEQGKLKIEQLRNQFERIIHERKQRGAGNRVLFEFINKTTARQFYNLIKESEIPVYELTGDDNPSYRKKLIGKLGKSASTGEFLLKEVIVVATQVIEAGVDIDMDVGFKDISLLDSEEQFLGRINRSCDRDDCHAYFFDMDDASMIYRDDMRIELDLREESYQKMLLTKDFSDFYNRVMQRINDSRERYNAQNWFKFETDIQMLDFPVLAKHMNLIPDRSVSLFLNYDLVLDNGTTISGEEVWDKFMRLVEDKQIDYSERKVKLSLIREQMSYFTFTYRITKGELPAIFSKVIGSLYYVDQAEQYMDWDEQTGSWKFNRSKYSEAERGLFL